MSDLRNATLVFLIKRSGGDITDICLAMKKRGFGKNRWNGVGGKVIEGETIEEAAKREAKEEVGVSVNDLRKVAEIAFHFPHNPSWGMLVHVYFSEHWDREPTESEEMNPRWFHPSEMPFQEMWPDEALWMPEVIKGNLLRGMFEFGEGDVIQNKKINIVGEL